ncbi:MAG: hypothetical protein Q8M54_07690 [Desulfobaccales bacterium]|nr:hypothetical protein [Desulfobaccales bacterium]
MASILGAAVIGVLVLLCLGGMLALVAALLPRVLLLWEGGPGSGRLGLEDMGPAPIGQTEMGTPRVPAGPERAITPEPSAFLTPPEAAASEDPMVAAAIGVALALFQGEVVRPEETAAGSPAASSWSLAGRWQAMQARLNLPKR